jgi:hypothetical protein
LLETAVFSRVFAAFFGFREVCVNLEEEKSSYSSIFAVE